MRARECNPWKTRSNLPTHSMCFAPTGDRAAGHAGQGREHFCDAGAGVVLVALPGAGAHSAGQLPVRAPHAGHPRQEHADRRQEGGAHRHHRCVILASGFACLLKRPTRCETSPFHAIDRYASRPGQEHAHRRQKGAAHRHCRYMVCVTLAMLLSLPVCWIIIRIPATPSRTRARSSTIRRRSSPITVNSPLQSDCSRFSCGEPANSYVDIHWYLILGRSGSLNGVLCCKHTGMACQTVHGWQTCHCATVASGLPCPLCQLL